MKKPVRILALFFVCFTIITGGLYVFSRDSHPRYGFLQGLEPQSFRTATSYFHGPGPGGVKTYKVEYKVRRYELRGNHGRLAASIESELTKKGFKRGQLFDYVSKQWHGSETTRVDGRDVASRLVGLTNASYPIGRPIAKTIASTADSDKLVIEVAEVFEATPIERFKAWIRGILP